MDPLDIYRERANNSEAWSAWMADAVPLSGLPVGSKFETVTDELFTVSDRSTQVIWACADGETNCSPFAASTMVHDCGGC